MNKMANNDFNQRLWAVSDPNWGEPVVIPNTVRSGQMDAEKAFLEDSSFGIYHGGSIHPYPDGTRGDMKRARKQGFKLVQFSITSDNVEIIG
tara:strand:- start:350 stop:625 length:276 start_codon:yes stop_codon:yes gene_type:complete